MKKFSMIIAMTIAPSLALAEENVCASLGDLAVALFDARERGAPMSDAMGIAKEGDPAAPIIRNIVVMLYEQPQYRTPENVARARNEFRNEVELVCFKLAQEGQ